MQVNTMGEVLPTLRSKLYIVQTIHHNHEGRDHTAVPVNIDKDCN